MGLRACWQNCFGEGDPRAGDPEVVSIDAMEDSLAPLEETYRQIRWQITGFEACYHESDREAERIIRAIGSGQPAAETGERPPGRKRELQNAYDFLCAWCAGQTEHCKTLCVGAIWADELAACLGAPTALKRWKVERIIEKLRQALEPEYVYHVMAFDTGEAGGPRAVKSDEYYKDHTDFLAQTLAAMIIYTLDGQPSEMPLAMAIDLLRPCNWNFANNFAILLRAVNGNLNAKGIFAPCSLNAGLTPLRGRLLAIADTLRGYWNQKATREADEDIIRLLGAAAPVKQWLAASLDKTIRFQLGV
jgi:hypothetical protein